MGLRIQEPMVELFGLDFGELVGFKCNGKDRKKIIIYIYIWQTLPYNQYMVHSSLMNNV